MVFKVKYTFTVPHRKGIWIIIGDQYNDYFISPCLVERLSQHPEAGSFCYYNDGHFVIQFECGEYIDDAKC